MTRYGSTSIAVIFVNQRSLNDPQGYVEAAEAMVALAKEQPGYLGVDSVRNEDGLGITISYWENEAAAKAWRDHPEHAAIRDRGRSDWYEYYDLHVAQVTRSYDWKKG